MEKTDAAKQNLRYYLCPIALKTAIFFKREKDFSLNYCIDPGVANWHYPYPDIMDQKYDRGRGKAV